MMAKPDYIIINKVNQIIYYFINHRLNASNKKLLFKNSPWNGQIKYINNTNEFYLTHILNILCHNIKEKIYDNIGDINDNIIKFIDLLTVKKFQTIF